MTHKTDHHKYDGIMGMCKNIFVLRRYSLKKLKYNDVCNLCSLGLQNTHMERANGKRLIFEQCRWRVYEGSLYYYFDFSVFLKAFKIKFVN